MIDKTRKSPVRKSKSPLVSPPDFVGVLGIASNSEDVVDGRRRIRVCGVILVPDDFPETEGFEKWLAMVEIKPLQKFVSKCGTGSMDNVVTRLGPEHVGEWKEKK